MKENLIEYNQLNVGDRVLIAPDTRFWEASTESNPRDIPGVITSTDGQWYKVLWDNGRKNGYEQTDLAYEVKREPIFVDANKIYLSKEPKDLNDIFNILYEKEDRYRSQETYYKLPNGDTVLQCSAGRMRSFDDFWIIACTYFGDVDPADVFRTMLLFDVTLAEVESGLLRVQLSNCSTIKRIRYTKSQCTFPMIWGNVDCNKFDSVYKWRDLFNMLYINNMNQLKEWYIRELTPKKEEKDEKI